MNYNTNGSMRNYVSKAPRQRVRPGSNSISLGKKNLKIFIEVYGIKQDRRLQLLTESFTFYKQAQQIMHIYRINDGVLISKMINMNKKKKSIRERNE